MCRLYLSFLGGGPRTCPELLFSHRTWRYKIVCFLSNFNWFQRVVFSILKRPGPWMFCHWHLLLKNNGIPQEQVTQYQNGISPLIIWVEEACHLVASALVHHWNAGSCQDEIKTQPFFPCLLLCYAQEKGSDKTRLYGCGHNTQHKNANLVAQP